MKSLLRCPLPSCHSINHFVSAVQKNAVFGEPVIPLDFRQHWFEKKLFARKPHIASTTENLPGEEVSVNLVNLVVTMYNFSESRQISLIRRGWKIKPGNTFHFPLMISAVISTHRIFANADIFVVGGGRWWKHSYQFTDIHYDSTLAHNASRLTCP